MTTQWVEWVGQSVPKKELVTALQLALQARRLKVAPDLPDAEVLSAELSAFRLRKVSINETDAAEWRVGRNDDLVFAVALACWFADQYPPQPPAPPRPPFEARQSKGPDVPRSKQNPRSTVSAWDVAGGKQSLGRALATKWVSSRPSWRSWSRRIDQREPRMISHYPFSPKFRALRLQAEAAALQPLEPPATSVEYTIGVDLGKTQDYSALCVIERTAPPAGEATYAVRHLRRWPLGTAYTKVADDVAELAYRPELKRPRIAADATGVGTAVMEMIAEAQGEGRRGPFG